MAAAPVPQVVAFDLDGTVWTPDMYQLWGGGAPFRKTPDADALLDASGAAVKLCGNTRQILREIGRSKLGGDRRQGRVCELYGRAGLGGRVLAEVHSRAGRRGRGRG